MQVQLQVLMPHLLQEQVEAEAMEFVLQELQVHVQLEVKVVLVQVQQDRLVLELPIKVVVVEVLNKIILVVEQQEAQE